MAIDYAPIIQAASNAYGTPAKVLTNVARRESGFRAGVMNDWDSNAAKGTPSGGLMQFIQPTYSAFSRQARAANPAAWKGVNDNWMDPQAQLLAASWAMANGKGSHWTTYKAALGDAGGRAVGPGNAPTRMASRPAGRPTGTATDGDPIVAGIFGNLNPIVGSLLAAEGAPSAPAPTSTTPQAASYPAAPVVAGRPTADGWRELQRIAQRRFGLQNDPGNSQTHGGGHSAGSEHYDGRAIDFGNARNTQAQLNAWLRWARANGYDAINEGDHIHVSLPGSGI